MRKETIILEGYDNTQYTFNKERLKEFVRIEYEQTLDEFLDTYIWDDTDYIKTQIPYL